ncbi:MAG: hypothetical protein K2N14_00630 [Clostridia bacterium]|nr:hypothetical protein [Clostridia bacterium]
MKDNQTVNRQTAADPAEAEDVQTAAAAGKFKDVEALLKAYQALEAEFTRRSQRLKELEASNKQSAPAIAENAEASSHKAENGMEGGNVSTEAQTQSAGAAQAEVNGTQTPTEMLSDEVKNAVIEEYLNGIFSKRGVPFVTGGGAVAAERRTPKTMSEAGALAEKLFSNREDN